MKKFLIVFFLALLIPAGIFGQVINNYDAAPADTNYWAWHQHVNGGASAGMGGHYEISNIANVDTGFVHVSYITDPVFEGSGAMRVDYSVHNTETWGGYSKIDHWHPDSNSVYDWTAYDSISFWYYNLAPQSLAGRITLRLCLHDVSNSPNGNATYTNGQCEYYYSFLFVLDSLPGWHEIKMPLKANASYWAGEGFNLTGWAGIPGNGVLDLDKIKGYTFEFSISGSGNHDVSAGTVILDNLMLKGMKAMPFIFFDGRNVPSKLSAFTWGQSTLEIVEGAGAEEGTNALKWVQGNEWGNGWTGAGYNISPVYNMAMAWSKDSLKFKMKADAGTGNIRMQFEAGAAKKGYNFDPITDGAWHDYAFKLSDFVYKEGANFDSSQVNVFQFMAEATGIVGKTIYFDHIWTGNPKIDIISPPPPSVLNAQAGQFFNLVFWQDVAGESGESYTIYASEKPITNLTDPAVMTVAANIAEGIQTVVHNLYFPLVNQNVTYYYAATCKDAAGNVSKTFTATATGYVNTAQGIPTISLTPPANFVADGDISEWDVSGIRPFVLKPETDHVPTGTVADSADLKATVYLAFDDNYFYFAADVIDNVYHYGAGNWYDQDAFQLFIGLYNQEGPAHNAIKRGVEPDYLIYAVEDRLQLDITGGGVLSTVDNINYNFTPLGGSDYVVEARVSLDSMAAAGSDSRFHPARGMRIPLDIYFHDNDGNGWEGNLGFSPLSTDHQWQYPYEWLYTWIGDTNHVVSAVENPTRSVINQFSLGQNYPNPFNPTTTIDYTLAKPGIVSMELYNVLGQKIRSLVANEYQAAGSHRIVVNAQDLTSGIYFYAIKVGEFKQMKKLVLMK